MSNAPERKQCPREVPVSMETLVWEIRMLEEMSRMKWAITCPLLIYEFEKSADPVLFFVSQKIVDNCLQERITYGGANGRSTL